MDGVTEVPENEEYLTRCLCEQGERSPYKDSGSSPVARWESWFLNDGGRERTLKQTQLLLSILLILLFHTVCILMTQEDK